MKRPLFTVLIGIAIFFVGMGIQFLLQSLAGSEKVTTGLIIAGIGMTIVYVSFMVMVIKGLFIVPKQKAAVAKKEIKKAKTDTHSMD